VVLLEEELRWMKAQYFGTSSQKTDAAAVNPDQAMLFNEAEVLAAIEAAEQAHRQRTTKVGAHTSASTRAVARRSQNTSRASRFPM
jgi:hypothetical protein